MFFLTSAYADHVEPEFVGGNPTCIDLVDDPDAVEFRINNPTDGNTAIIDDATAATYVDPVTGFTITIDVYQSADGPEFNFYDASIALDAVFVKGGPNGNLYEYDPSVTEDTGLHSPLNPSNDKWFGLSHISFCWVPRPSTVLTLDAIDPGTTVLAGSDVTLTFAETNDGNFVLSNATVTADNGCTPAFDSGDTNTNGDLDPGETWLFECTVEDIVASTTITAIGRGETPDGDLVTWCEDPDNPPADTICDQDEIEEVEIDVINPSTELTLSSSDPGLTVLAGTEVTLTFAEENNGDVALDDPTVTADNGCTPAFVSGDTNGNGDLDTDETWLFECTIIPEADVTITAIASGVDPLGNTVTWCEDPDNPPAGTVCDQDEIEEVDIDVISPKTELSLDAADPGTTILRGESVTLTFAEANTGDVELENPTVTADNGCDPAYVSGDTNDDGDLDTDEIWLFECTIVDIVSDTTITAIASGVDPLGNTVTWCEDPDNPPADTVCDQDEIEEVDIDVINPSTVLTLSSANPGTTIDEGDSVTLTFAEDNNGDVELENPMVTADNGCTPVFDSGDTNGDGDLDTDETWLFVCTISPTSDVTITAIGSGVDPLGNTVTWCEDPDNPPTDTVCDQDEIVVVPITVIPAGEGCTPGFWKTHPDSWGPTGYSTGQTVEDVFNVPDGFGLDDKTLLEALGFPGGSGTTGAARTLLRAAVAALLNAGHPDINYPRTEAEIIADVNAALAGSRSDMLTLASELDADNNLGCSIS